MTAQHTLNAWVNAGDPLGAMVGILSLRVEAEDAMVAALLLELRMSFALLNYKLIIFNWQKTVENRVFEVYDYLVVFICVILLWIVVEIFV